MFYTLYIFSKNNFPLLKARPNSYLFTADLIFFTLSTDVFFPRNIPIILNERALEPTFDAAGQWRSHLRFSALLFIASRRHFECCFFKSPHYVPPGIRWEDPNGVGNGQQLYFLPGLTHLVSRKNIALLLNKLKFEKTDTVFIKGLHSGLWQNFLSLLAQTVVEQKADKLFS